MAREATATRVCGASRPRARRGIASTGSRSAVAPWRSSRRRGRSLAAVRWCFRALGGKPIGNTAMSELLRELNIAAVPHGFRSSFRDWAAEETDHPREVAEAALAHKVRSQIEAAYRRSDLF